MKKLFLALTFVFLFSSIQYSQGLYYAKYSFFNASLNSNFTYEGLIGWYGPGQFSFMRIRYYLPETKSYIIVQQRITFLNYGTQGYVLHGDTPFFITPAPAGHAYNSDSLIFQPTGNGYFGLSKVMDTATKQLGVPLEFRALNNSEVAVTLKLFGFQPPTANYNPGTSNSNVTMHLIVVADTEDPEIGSGDAIDARAVRREFEIAANALGVSFVPVMITGSLFSRDTVANTLNNLNPGANDIVIFVYTGHGFRFKNETDPYPSFYLVRNREDPAANSLSASQVYQALKRKRSRLNITIVDACNTEIRMSKPTYAPSIVLKDSDAGINKQATAKLFLNTSGNIIVASASKGETSVTNGVQGGVFMRSFLSSFRHETSLINFQTPTWTNIIMKAREQAYQIPRSEGTQTATYYID